MSMSDKNDAPAEDQLESKGKDKRIENVEEFFNVVSPVGRYSIVILIIMAILQIYLASLTFSLAFISVTPEFTCNLNSSIEQSDISNCHIDTINNECQVSVNCSQSLRQVDCSSWTFSQEQFTNTIVSRFALVCDRASLAELPSTLFFAGFLFGSTMFGMVSDYFGRRVALLSSIGSLIASNILAALAPTYWMYGVAVVLMGLAAGGAIAVVFTFGLEATNAKYRFYWSANIYHGWSTGAALVALVAYLNRDYQQQLLILCAGAVVYLPLAVFAGESPRWLLSTGRLARAHDAVMRVVRMNRATHKLPPDFNAAELAPKDNKHTSSISSSSSSSSSSEEEKSYSLIDLFRTPGIRRITLLGWIHWFVASMTYYGISLSAGSIGGDIFANAALVAAVEVPARFLEIALTIFGIGRKPILCFSFILSAVFQAIMVATFQLENIEAIRIALAIISKMGITIAFDFVWIYYSEIYPTVIRSVGAGSGSTVARIGAMVCTLLLQLRTVWEPLPFIIFSIGPFVACAVVYFIPETMGKNLPETIEDGERFVLNVRGKVDPIDD